MLLNLRVRGRGSVIENSMKCGLNLNFTESRSMILHWGIITSLWRMMRYAKRQMWALEVT